MPLAGARDLHAPVAYVQTPVTAKPKSACKAILGFYGADTKNMDLPDLVRQVAASIRDHGTKALLLDDITRLRMHRADDQDVLDLIRAFMSMHVTLVLIGVDIPGSGLLREGRPDPAPASGSSRPPGTQAAAPWRPPRPSGGSTWSSWTGSATTPRPRSPPGPGTWPASSSSCG